MATETVRGGAPPHTDTLIRTAAYGRVQIRQFKTRRQCFVRSLASPFHRTPTRARTTRKPVRWTLALTSAETNYLGESKTS